MIDLRLGDCLELMREIETASVDAVITFLISSILAFVISFVVELAAASYTIYVSRLNAGKSALCSAGFALGKTILTVSFVFNPLLIPVVVIGQALATYLVVRRATQQNYIAQKRIADAQKQIALF